MPQALSKVVVEQAKEYMSQGMSQVATAKQLGVCNMTTHRIAKTYKKDIEKLALDIVNESIPFIRRNHINTLKLADTLLSNGDLEAIEANKTLLTLADKKEFRALQVMGIAPSTTPSIIINQLLNVDTVNIVDVGVQAALGGYLGDIMSDSDVTDADYTDDMSNTDQDS